jgi:hypothetical protein
LGTRLVPSARGPHTEDGEKSATCICRLMIQTFIAESEMASRVIFPSCLGSCSPCAARKWGREVNWEYSRVPFFNVGSVGSLDFLNFECRKLPAVSPDKNWSCGIFRAVPNGSFCLHRECLEHRWRKGTWCEYWLQRWSGSGETYSVGPMRPGTSGGGIG